MNRPHSLCSKPGLSQAAIAAFVSAFLLISLIFAFNVAFASTATATESSEVPAASTDTGVLSADEDADDAVEAAQQSDIVHFEAINYYVARHFNAYGIAVTGFLPPGTELPATVELAIPAGSEIIWFSEFAPGQPITAQIEFTEPFDVRRVGDLDIYTVTLTASDAVQIEYHMVGEPNTRLSEGVYSLAMQYMPIADLPVLRLMTNLPPESVVTDPSVEFMGVDEDEYLVFMRVYTDVAANTMVSGEITYMPPAGTGMIAAGGNLVGGLAVIVISVVLVIIAAAGFIFYTNKKRSSQL